MIALAFSLIFTVQCQAQVQVSGPVDLQKRPFTLVLLKSHQNPQFGAMVESMIKNPQSQEMREWASLATVKTLWLEGANGGINPLVQEHHADLAQTGQTVLALVDSMGGVWAKFADNRIPMSDYELARQIDVRYQAAMEAAREAGVDAFRFIQPEHLQHLVNDDRAGPLFPNRERRPIVFNPQVTVPDSGLNFGVFNELKVVIIAGVVILGLLLTILLLFGIYKLLSALLINDPG